MVFKLYITEKYSHNNIYLIFLNCSLLKIMVAPEKSSFDLLFLK